MNMNMNMNMDMNMNMNTIDSRYLTVDSQIDPVPDTVTPTQLIADTFKIYGSIFAICFTIFVFLRLKFPLTYTSNSQLLSQVTPLASDASVQSGIIIAWIPKIFRYTDDELFEHCGMSAVVYLRFLLLGVKISAVGVLNSVYLFPVDMYGCNSSSSSGGNEEECVNLEDVIDRMSLGHVSSGSPSLIATTVAAYIVFGSALYLIYKEFEWYRTYRHKFCVNPQPDNYSIYVEHIPIDFRNDASLQGYFESIFSAEDVVEARVALDIRNLDKKVALRKKAIEKLEHAVNVRDVKGYEPSHLTSLGEKVQSIPIYAKELDSLNHEIADAILSIENAGKGGDLEEAEVEDSGTLSIPNSIAGDHLSHATVDHLGPLDLRHDGLEHSEKENGQEDQGLDQEQTNYSPIMMVGKGLVGSAQKVGKGVVGSAQIVGKGVVESAQMVGKGLEKSVVDTAQLAGKLLGGSQDGRVLDAGFVTFSTLLVKNQALQVLHSETPFTFDVKDAPPPKDIIWSNVGKAHKEQQIGHLLAQVMTVATCLFWTIPVAFVSSLSEVESLQDLIPGLEKAIEKNPWLASFLGQLSPIMLVVLTSLLPMILKIYCKHEGHIGENSLNASLLSKLASFMIIQVFFVQALSGSLFQSLEDMIKTTNFSAIIDLLATSVPGQVKSFIQYVQVQNLLGCSIELLRVKRVVMALIRKRIGPRLTEKERNSPFMGILPMIEPDKMEYPTLLAQMVLYFMINLVYSCIAPIMSYFTLLAFGILSLTYRHQLIFTYSRDNEDGGALWPSMINLLILCIYMSEFTLLGILTLKKGAIAATLMSPLIILSFIFILYVRQQHFKVAEYAPSTVCRAKDNSNRDNLIDTASFLRDQFLQPSLKEKESRIPENFSDYDVQLVLEASVHEF